MDICIYSVFLLKICKNSIAVKCRQMQDASCDEFHDELDPKYNRKYDTAVRNADC